MLNFKGLFILSKSPEMKQEQLLQVPNSAEKYAEHNLANLFLLKTLSLGGQLKMF